MQKSKIQEIKEEFGDGIELKDVKSDQKSAGPYMPYVTNSLD